MNAPEPCNPYVIHSLSEHIRSASVWLEANCRKHHVPSEQLERLDICLNEAIANILSHGGSSALDEPLILEFHTGTDASSGKANLSLSDGGLPFNPLTAMTRPTPSSLEEATPGGLGLSMMKNYSDHIEYDYREGRNHLTFVVNWDIA